MALQLPQPESPDEHVAQLLDLLRTAKRELDDARRIVHMLAVDTGAEPIPTRLCIETDVATRRVQLWRDEVRAIETNARALGIDVRATL